MDVQFCNKMQTLGALSNSLKKTTCGALKWIKEKDLKLNLWTSETTHT
jgi:hypothetical protein